MININRWIPDGPLKFGVVPHHGISLVFIVLFRHGIPPVTGQSTGATLSGYPYAPDLEFNFTLTVLIVVLVTAFFFIGFFSIFIRHCSDIDNSPDSSVHNRTQPPATGLDSSLINSFPIFLYASVKEHKSGNEALECAVCITEFEDSDSLRLLPKCDHVFHPDCIDTWLLSHSTCPVCRSNLENRAESMNSSQGSEIQNRILMLPRSHSTGHDSLSQTGEYGERYTLRLPEGVRKQIVTLSRTTSCVVVLTTEENSTSNLDRVFLRSDRVGRWGFWKAKVGFESDVSFTTPHGYLASWKSDIVEQSANRLPQVWAASDFVVPQFTAVSFVGWWNDFQRSLSPRSIELAVMVLWNLWVRRNSKVWQRRFLPASSIIHQAKASLATWRSIHSSVSRPLVRSGRQVVRWSVPPVGWLKLNVDASSFSNPAGNGVGGVLRDDSGSFVAAFQNYFEGDRSVKEAEALGIREALSWIKDKHLSKVIIESDSQLCVDAVNSGCEDLSYFGLFIGDCISLFKDIEESKLVFSRRSANLAAHSLAREASSVSGLVV